MCNRVCRPIAAKIKAITDGMYALRCSVSLLCVAALKEEDSGLAGPIYLPKTGSATEQKVCVRCASCVRAVIRCSCAVFGHRGSRRPGLSFCLVVCTFCVCVQPAPLSSPRMFSLVPRFLLDRIIRHAADPKVRAVLLCDFGFV